MLIHNLCICTIAGNGGIYLPCFCVVSFLKRGPLQRNHPITVMPLYLGFHFCFRISSDMSCRLCPAMSICLPALWVIKPSCILDGNRNVEKSKYWSLNLWKSSEVAMQKMGSDSIWLKCLFAFSTDVIFVLIPLSVLALWLKRHLRLSTRG